MIVRTLSELDESSVTRGKNWTSRRLLLRGDGMGFSLHDTLIHPGTRTHIHYANHLEAVYCIEGKGSVTLVKTGEKHPIEAGQVYALDENDEHWLEAETQMRMVCVFSPALLGTETHDENGIYPLLADDGSVIK